LTEYRSRSSHNQQAQSVTTIPPTNQHSTIHYYQNRQYRPRQSNHTISYHHGPSSGASFVNKDPTLPTASVRRKQGQKGVQLSPYFLHQCPRRVRTLVNLASESRHPRKDRPTLQPGFVRASASPKRPANPSSTVCPHLRQKELQVSSKGMPKHTELPGQFFLSQNCHPDSTPLPTIASCKPTTGFARAVGSTAQDTAGIVHVMVE
jgi:hypothetical protein